MDNGISADRHLVRPPQARLDASEVTEPVFVAMGIPVSILTAVLLALGWRAIVPPKFHMTSPFAGLGLQVPLIFLLLLIPAGLLVIFIHELLHCAGHPRMGFSSASYIGVWPSRFMFYSVYLGDIMSNRNLIFGLLPFVVLSIVPLFLCIALDTSPGSHSVLLAFASILNGVCCCSDLLIVPIICWQVPHNATIHDRGWEMYWKKTEEPTDNPIRSEHD